jgi:type VI secretion system secreted protein VgrG
MNHKTTTLIIALLALWIQPAFSASPGTSFTYQGRLSSGINAAAGLYDLTFSVWDASTGATQVGNTLTNAAVGVTNGLFTVTLDFGSGVFDGNARWLEIGVRTNGSTSFVILAPRQALTATPYAQYAPGAGFAAQASAVTAGAITTSMLANGAVTSAKIGTAAVKPSNIDDGGNAIYQGFLNPASSMDSTAPLPFSALSLVSSNSGTAPSFSFTLDAVAFGTVVSFTGHEGMSEPYAYVVEALAAPGLLDPKAQMGRQGRLSFARNGRTTAFAGLVTGCSASSYDGTNDLYTFRLESTLDYLALNTDYRIYQQQIIPDIVTSLYQGLTAYTLSKSLSGAYTPPPNTIQYAETALNFFQRHLESEGIFYYFSLDGTPPTLNLADNPNAYPAGNVATFLYYGDTSTNIPAGAEFIRSFQKAGRQSTKVSLLNAYDFTKPQTDLTRTASSSDGLGQGTNYEFDAAISDISVVQAHVKVQQERQDLERSTYFGTANGPDLRAGYTFTLTDQSGSSLGNTYLVTSVQHAAFRRTANGVASFYYGNQFEVIPSTMSFRPAAKTPKPVALPCVANVTGPTGEEIYVDKYGRVKVQFQWDRYGANNETSSAWLRVASQWAGRNHGMLFLPRIGDEVMVEFVQGDPDQPVVTGSFYNAVATPQYSLPANQTRSMIKTLSSKGGAGANEIMFEDLTGSELLAITGQRDFSLSANHDISISATHDLSITAGQGIGINAASDPAFALKVGGTIGATLFQGGGSGLTNLLAAGLPADVAYLDSNQVFSAQTTFTGPIGLFNTVQDYSDLFMNDQDIHARNDAYHGIGWYGDVKPFAGFAVNGPVVYGFSGGALGFKNFTATNLVLDWTSGGYVGINNTNPIADLDVHDTSGYGGIIHVGANVTGGDAKLIRFGDGDYVHIGENGADDRMDLKAATFYFNHASGNGNVGIGTNNPQAALHVVGNILATGTITPNSDRNAKTDFAPVDPAAVLECVAKLPIQQWRFKAEPEGVKHVGPMAQDFRAVFGLGEIPTAIATVDADGVALAAIQGLNQKLEDRDAEIQALRRQNALLEKRLNALELLISSVTEKN